MYIFLNINPHLYFRKDGKKAADMTEEPEMIYLLKDFSQYKRVRTFIISEIFI